MTNKPRRPYGEGKPKCDAQRPNQPEGTLCQRPAGWATDHPGTGRCKRHGGSSPTHRQNAQMEQAKQLAGIYGAPRTIDPRDGIIEEYYRSAGIILMLEQHVAQLPRDELVWGVVEEEDGVGDQGGMMRRTSRAVPNVWVKLLNEERDRFWGYSRDIMKFGLEARRDEWMRTNGIAMSDVFRRAIARAGVVGEAAQALMDALIAEISDEVDRLAGPRAVAA